MALTTVVFPVRAGRRDIPTRKQIRVWCEQNCQHHWHLSWTHQAHDQPHRVKFTDEGEAMWFCLTWPTAVVKPHLAKQLA